MVKVHHVRGCQLKQRRTIRTTARTFKGTNKIKARGSWHRCDGLVKRGWERTAPVYRHTLRGLPWNMAEKKNTCGELILLTFGIYSVRVRSSCFPLIHVIASLPDTSFPISRRPRASPCPPSFFWRRQSLHLSSETLRCEPTDVSTWMALSLFFF